MKNRKTLIIFIGMSLTLFFTSQVLAQAPIEGWGKAKFGMSPEEVKEAYKKEKEYYEDKFYQEINFIKKYYANDLEKMAIESAAKVAANLDRKEFWYEREECWSREKEGIGYPHQLLNTWLQILGENTEAIVFNFVHNQLYNIEIKWEYLDLGKTFPPGLKEESKLSSKLIKLKNILIKKYGDSFKKEELKEKAGFTETSAVVKEEILTWVDESGNTLKVENRFRQLRYKKQNYNILYYCAINYFDANLAELWARKQIQWRKEVAEWEKREKRLREKEMESF